MIRHIPRGYTVRHLLARRKERAALNTREGHVKDEQGFIVLRDRDTPFETKYVVHEHVAEKAGRHFDLRVEIDGEAVSWAVPMKGTRSHLSRFPKPGETWLAVRQPDHTVSYMSFEGNIPEGYGKGDVSIWAAGVCDVLRIENGNVHVRFYGGLKGDYVLVRSKGLQGLLVPKKYEPGDPWSKPKFTKREPERLQEYEDKGYVAENKIDGAALELVVIPGGYIRAFSHRISRRDGNLIEHTARLAHVTQSSRLPDLSGTRIRAEAWHRRGVGFLSGTLNSGVEKSRQLQGEYGPIQLACLDITHYKGRDVRALPDTERRTMLESVCGVLGPNVKPVERIQSGFRAAYENRIANKSIPSDGLVLKDPMAPFGESPYIKVKPHDTVDCEVTRVVEGLGKHSGRLGALTVRTSTGKDIQCGTGFSDAQRHWIWSHRDDVIGSIARVKFHFRGGETSHSGPRFDSWHPDDPAARMYAETEPAVAAG